MNNTINDQTNSMIKYLYCDKGKAMNKIAKELGIAVGTVYNRLKAIGIVTRGKYDYKTTNAQRENWRKIGKMRKGLKHSEETKIKMSESSKIHGIGHKKLRKDGYVAVYYPDYESSNNSGYVMEHVYIMEQCIGRKLNDDEVVHHKNKIRNDNRIENLEVMTKSEHMSYHSKKRWEEKKGVMTY